MRLLREKGLRNRRAVEPPARVEKRSRNRLATLSGVKEVVLAGKAESK
jgi:hypothetical protein